MTTQPQAYSGGSSSENCKIDLSRNEGRSVLEPFSCNKSSGEIELNRYPSLDSLRAAMSQFYQVANERIVPTAGGDQAIEVILRWVQLRCKQPARMLCHAPSFEMLDVYANNIGMKKSTIEWSSGSFPVQSFIESFSSVDVAIVVSPNNPTGLSLSCDELKQLAAEAKRQNTLLVLDFAYIEFSESDPMLELGSGSNVFFIRTLSKAWGLAGLRVGCAITPDVQTSRELAAIRGPFPISSASIQLATLALEKNQGAMDKNVRATRENREVLQKWIEDAGGTCLTSQGNFLLAQFDPDIQMVPSMEKRGIRVRQFSQRPDWSERFRITIPTDLWEMETIRAALEDAVGKTISGSPAAIEFGVSSKPSHRRAQVTRETRETKIEVLLDLDGKGDAKIRTGLGFLDHMLTALACHSGIDLQLSCKGDLEVDDHHTIEDCAIVLGDAIAKALGDKRGIARFATAYAPLDESLVRCVIDLSGRPATEIHLQFEREMIGSVATENIVHFFESLGVQIRCALHLDLIRSRNAHHQAEAAFKAFAICLKNAIALCDNRIPSTKGVI